MERFLRYVKTDTQSAEDQTTVPSTKKQCDLANLLVKELKDLGTENVRLSEYCVVYASVPGNLPDIPADLQRTALPESVYRRPKLPRQTGVQFATRAGEKHRDAA